VSAGSAVAMIGPGKKHAHDERQARRHNTPR
jgi:hypothetical protein